jgi:hypothetical protein
MITKTPCTTNYIASMFNQTMHNKNSLTKCQMGVNLKDVKSESLIVCAHSTSLLATQHLNLSIWLNIILPPLKKLTFNFFHFSIMSPFWFPLLPLSALQQLSTYLSFVVRAFLPLPCSLLSFCQKLTFWWFY